MWEVFEQYGFLRNAADTSRIKEATFWSAVVNGIMMITGLFNYWANEVLGMSSKVAIMIFVIMLLDLISGIMASTYEGERLCSKKGLRWVIKFGSYTAFIYVLNTLVKEAELYSFDWVTYSMNVIRLFVIFVICFWELKSIDENSERLGYSFRIFKLLNPIYNVFAGIIKKNSDVDIKKDNDREC